MPTRHKQMTVAGNAESVRPWARHYDDVSQCCSCNRCVTFTQSAIHVYIWFKLRLLLLLLLLLYSPRPTTWCDCSFITRLACAAVREDTVLYAVPRSIKPHTIRCHPKDLLSLPLPSTNRQTHSHTTGRQNGSHNTRLLDSLGRNETCSATPVICVIPSRRDAKICSTIIKFREKRSKFKLTSTSPRLQSSVGAIESFIRVNWSVVRYGLSVVSSCFKTSWIIISHPWIKHFGI